MPTSNSHAKALKDYRTAEDVPAGSAVDRILAHATADADAAREQSQLRLLLAQEVGNIGCYEIDMRDGTTVATSGFFALYGLPTDRTTITREEWFAFIHPGDQDRMAELLKSARTGVEEVNLDYRIVRVDGEVRWTFSRLKLDLDPEGRAVRGYGIQQDITSRKLAEMALAESEEHHRCFVQVSPAIVWTADPQGKITITGNQRSVGLGLPSDAFDPHGDTGPLTVHPDDLDLIRAGWQQSLATGEPHDLEYRLRMPGGEYRWYHTRAYPRFDDNRRILRWYGASEDITERKTVEQQLRWHADHDALTGLANRRAFQIALEEGLSAAAAGTSVGLILIDLDRFKMVNDRFGHDIGDALIVATARRIAAALPETGFAARLGGDEFAVIAKLYHAKQLPDLLDRLSAQFQAPCEVGGYLIDSRASLGAAIGPSDGKTPGSLFKCADLALYAAKASGRGQGAVYTSSMGQS